MESKYKVLASNTVVFAIGNILVKLISFFLMPLYTSVLTTEQYGVAELLNNSIEIVLPIATLCIVEALYRFAIDENSDHSTIFVDALFITIIGDFLVIIGCLIWFFILHYKYALFFMLLFITTTFYKLTIQFARGLGHVKRYSFYGVLNSLLLIISNVLLLVVFKGGVESYLLSFSIGYGLSGIIAYILSKEYKYVRFNEFNLVTLKEMLEYSLPNIPNMLSWWVNSLSDRYIVLYYWGASITGLYTAASKLPAMINLVTSIFQQAWQYSTATEIDAIDNSKFFSNIFRGYVYFCTFACAGLLIVNKLICKILLQSEFYAAWKFVPLLLLAATFGCISTYFGTFYNAIKNNKMLMISTIAGAIINFVFNLILIPKFGGMGAAIATALSYFVIMMIRMFDVCRFIDITIDFKRFWIQFVSLVVSVIFSCYKGSLSIFVTVLIFIIIALSDILLMKRIVRILIKLINKSN
jgi:O-antigen/teichoic acid export membrane protein